MGMDKSFIRQQFDKYSGYISKIPGMDVNTGRSMVDALTGAMPDSQPSQQPSAKKAPRFDSKKYPKL